MYRTGGKIRRFRHFEPMSSETARTDLNTYTGQLVTGMIHTLFRVQTLDLDPDFL